MPLGSIYTSLTGLLTFSRGLDTISNNVANLNTPGFKRSDLLFRDLFYQQTLTGEANGEASYSRLGNGVTDRGTITSFSQGELQESGNDLDAAIDGNGFFVLREGEDIFYTRAGQFKLDEDYYLISTALEARVAGIDSDGNLIDINITDFRTYPANSTSQIKFVENLSTGSAEHEIQNVEVFDSLGLRHALTIHFENNSTVTPRSWLINIKDENGDIIAEDLEIRFQGNGTPEENFNSVSFTYQSGDALPAEITLLFGEPGSFTGATSFSSGNNSNLAVDSQDGYAAGSLLKASFERDGVLHFEYTNAQSQDGSRLALAWFNDLQSLQQIGQGLFLLEGQQVVQLGAPTEKGLGEIVGGTVEISNVELTEEFTALIIVQRGFQSASQVISVANEMIQQLLDITKGR